MQVITGLEPASTSQDAFAGVVAASLAAPPVPKVERDLSRPLWSVMIPTYNCADFLRSTLASVLSQDPGPAHMQIEVVDDVSTRDNPEAVVKELGQGRVEFFRQPRNGGAIENFNTCLRRSRGRLIHVLHGDDLAEGGFYRTVSDLVAAHPDCGLFATTSWIIDEQGKRLRKSPSIAALQQPSADPRLLLYDNPLRTPAVVVRREVYEKQGGFLPQLIHVADWEMWARAIAAAGGVMLAAPLASYRVFGGNDTARLRRSGENLLDHLRLADIFASRFPSFDRRQFCWRLRVVALTQMTAFREKGDWEAWEATRGILRTLDDPERPLAWRVREWVVSLPYVRRLALALLERLMPRPRRRGPEPAPPAPG